MNEMLPNQILKSMVLLPLVLICAGCLKNVDNQSKDERVLNDKFFSKLFGVPLEQRKDVLRKIRVSELVGDASRYEVVLDDSDPALLFVKGFAEKDGNQVFIMGDSISGPGIETEIAVVFFGKGKSGVLVKRFTVDWIVNDLTLRQEEKKLQCKVSVSKRDGKGRISDGNVHISFEPIGFEKMNTLEFIAR